MIKIDKGIKIPGLYGKHAHYPFGEMALGDSFMVQPIEVVAIRQAASHYARRHGKKMKFSIRKYEGNYRCWRVK